MQINRLHKNIYNLYRYSRTQECLQQYRDLYQTSVHKWEEAKENGNTQAFCQKYAGISRATYYRRKDILKDLDKGIHPPSKKPQRLNKPRWREAEKQLVLKLRRDNPTYGKEKIAVILRRDYSKTISQSTVGRILKYLKAKGLTTKSSSALRIKRKRLFNKHAKPWVFKHYPDMVMGERVQIDHMTVTKNGITVKHFQAWERRSKYLFARVYSKANALSAKRFLLDFMANAPFTILSIQVDGGSEFMAAFEDACLALNIPLIVLPPAKPTYNGGVERSNRIFREEFYNRSNLLEDSVRGMQSALSHALNKYNTYRPHHALHGQTPMQYITSHLSEATSVSHIM